MNKTKVCIMGKGEAFFKRYWTPIYIEDHCHIDLHPIYVQTKNGTKIITA